MREAGAAFQRGDEIKAARLAVDRGQLVVEDGPRAAKKYLPAPTYPDLPRPTPAGEVLTYPDLPSIGRGRSAGVVNGPPTPALCSVCAKPLAPPLADAGHDRHPSCAEPAEAAP